MSFNLTTEPWIPVMLTNGDTAELSLVDTFRNAENIRRISADLPTQSFALLRLLLAICHDAIGFHYQEDVAAIIRGGLPTDQIIDYLEAHQDRLDLFDPKRPFMQVAGLRTAKDEASGLEKLICDVPNGDPFLTLRNGSALTSITAAEAAVWLVHCQAFDPSGIRSGAVGDPEVKGGKGYPIGPSWSGQLGGVILHGTSLAQTLVYNLVPTPQSDADCPVWAQEQAQTVERQMEPSPKGPVELLTWQSRRIRLIGDRTGVTGLVLSQGDKMTPQNRHLLEAMSAWRYSKPQSKKHSIPVYMPLKHDPSRAGWRGLPALLSNSPKQEQGMDATLRPATVDSVAGHSLEFADLESTVGLELVGMDYGPQEATVTDLVHDVLDFRVSLLGDGSAPVRALVHDSVNTADSCVWTLGRLAGNLASAAGDFDGVDGARASATLAGWAALDAPARRWLAGLHASSDTVAEKRSWQKQVRSVMEQQAARLVTGCSPAAVTGRDTKYGYLTAGLAENYFHSALRKELPLAYPVPEKIEEES